MALGHVVAIGNTAPVSGLMLPAARAVMSGQIAAAVEVLVNRDRAGMPPRVEVVVMMIDNHDLTPAPVERAEEKRRGDVVGRAPVKSHRGPLPRRVTPVNWGIAGPAPVAEDHARIVIRHVNNLTARRLNIDYLALAHDPNMLIAVQMP